MDSADTKSTGPAQSNARDIESNAPSSTPAKTQDPETSRWWFASTASPLLAATLGPIASGFNICALVSYWRSSVFPGTTEEFGIDISDPPWLLAINAVSVLSAVIANGALLLNMGRHLKFSTAQPITITGFFLAGGLLIVCMATLTSSPTLWIDVKHTDTGRHVLTSAFYFAVFATFIYLIVGVLMCVTEYGARKGYYEKDFQLSASQRTLMIQTMVFVAYLLLGAWVFSKVEGWTYLQGVYFTDVTLLTIGLGDFAPRTSLGRGLFIPFAVTGILIVGLVVSSIRTLVLERARQNIATQITENRRSAAISDVDAHKHTIRISYFATATLNTDDSLTAAQRREEEFKIMRLVQETAERDRQYLSLAISLTVGTILWFLGAAIFMVAEHREQKWSYFSALYFTYVCLLTIGYGDLTPRSNAGRAFFVMWSILAVPALTILISDLSETFIRWFSQILLSIDRVTKLLRVRAWFNGTRKISNSKVAVNKARQLDGTDEKELLDGDKHHRQLIRGIADRLADHIDTEELEEALAAETAGDMLGRDIHFYHYVLSRECRRLQQTLLTDPAKQYTWHEWEYYLRLARNVDHDTIPPIALTQAPVGASSKKSSDVLSPEANEPQPAAASSVPEHDGAVDRETELKNRMKWTQQHRLRHVFTRRSSSQSKGHPGIRSVRQRKQQRRQLTDLELQDWSWLSDRSPLASCARSETQWILDALSRALVRDLHATRKGIRNVPPVGMNDICSMRAREVDGRWEVGSEAMVQSQPRDGGKV